MREVWKHRRLQTGMRFATETERALPSSGQLCDLSPGTRHVRAIFESVVIVTALAIPIGVPMGWRVWKVGRAERISSDNQCVNVPGKPSLFAVDTLR